MEIKKQIRRSTSDCNRSQTHNHLIKSYILAGIVGFIAKGTKARELGSLGSGTQLSWVH